VNRPWHRMDDSERRNWQDPEAILSGIGLKAGDTFVDMGCGRGFFTRAAARMVGVRGKVYGVDIDGEAIQSIKTAAASEGLKNIELAVARAEDTVFCKGCADVVFFGIVLHDFADPAQVLANAATMLAPKGILANLDWKKETTPFGPPVAKRFDEATASRLITSAGLVVVSTKESGPYHYLIIARPTAKVDKGPRPAK
jgi:ubiquinone/menaquinone biosynthesis C-methylase UbiE